MCLVVGVQSTVPLEDRRILSHHEVHLRSKTGISLDRIQDKRAFCDLLSGLSPGENPGIQAQKGSFVSITTKNQEVLNAMNFAEVKIENSRFLIKTKFDSLGNKIVRLLQIKPPKNVTSTSELSW